MGEFTKNMIQTIPGLFGIGIVIVFWSGLFSFKNQTWANVALVMAGIPAAILFIGALMSYF